MIVNQVSNDRREEWDAFAAQQPAFAFMQSWDWGEFKQKMGWQAYRLAVKRQDRIAAAAQLFVKPLPGSLGSIAYIPRGPLCDWSERETVTSLLAEIHRVARAHKAVFLKIEPPLLRSSQNETMLQGLGFRFSSNTNQPRNTIVMDIDRDLETIFGQMRKKTRQYIRKAEKEEITVRACTREDLPAFINLMHQMGRREKFPARSSAYYETEWEIFSRNGQAIYLMAYHGGNLAAVRSAYRFGSHSAEFHAGYESGNAGLHVNYLLVWECIKWAREHGCTTFDLWGIPDDIGGSIEEDEQQFNKRTDGLWGVYHFKSGFSKNIVTYAGAYDFVYSGIPYTLFTKLLNRETIERLAVWGETKFLN